MKLNEIKQLDAQYYMPVFGERLPVAFTRGEGVTLYDTDGKAYTDFLAGIAVNALGYSDAGFRSAIRQQVDNIVHTSNYFYNEQQAELAQLLCKKTSMDRVFFTNSGTEAIECAIKLAKKQAYQSGSASARFVSLKNSFHGRTLAALTATGQDKFHLPFEPGTYTYTYIDANDTAAATAAITADTCGVLLEPVQGEGGVYPLDKAFVQHIRKLCDATGALLIADEIQSGMGRTGTFLALEQYGVRADVVTLAKALGNGIPIGVCLATQEAAQSFVPGDHGSTFGGGHLACAAGLYVTNAVDATMLQHIADTGAYFQAQLLALMQKHPHAITDVRGLGLMLGAQLKDGHSNIHMRNELLARGFVVGTAGANTLRFVPPYIIQKQDIDTLISALDEVL